MRHEAGQDVLHKTAIRLKSCFQYRFSSLRVTTVLKNQITSIIVLKDPECPVALIHVAFTVCFPHSVFYQFI